MTPRCFTLSKRTLALLATFALMLGGAFATPASPAAAADDYLGVLSNGRGTVLGTAAYAPAAGSIYVNASAGDDANPGTVSRPVKTVARALDISASGGTIVLRAGIYHESVTIKKRVTIQNYPKEVAWFDGSTAVPGWQKSGEVWTANWHAFFSPSSYSGGVRNDYPFAHYPGQVFIDGTPLKEVGSASAVRAGTFYADASNRRLVIGSDPSNRKVAASDLASAIQVGTTNVTLRGFGVRRYATTANARAAVLADPAGGTFENLVIADNASRGLVVSGANETIRQVVIERNGMMGVNMDRSNNSSVTRSVIRYNNAERFPTLPVAAGIKITWSSGMNIDDNLISGNYFSTGVWFDAYSSDIRVTNNTLTDNDETQLNLEAAQRAIVANNDLLGGRKAIEVRDSEAVRILNNRIGGYSLMGISLSQDNRWTKRPGDAPSSFALLHRNNTIANNLFACGTRFQLFANDESGTLSADKFNNTITGNLFSSRRTAPELNLMGWGLGSNNYDFIQTPAELAKKNSSWSNIQAQSCVSKPESTVSGSTLSGIALPIPGDIATLIGVASGTKAVGPVAGGNPTVNQSPSAKIDSSSSGLSVVVSGAQSFDPDGTVTTYSWNFGDGSSSSGSSYTHTYAKPGNYTVTLTVTDNDGAKSSASISIVLPANENDPQGGVVTVTDGFARKVGGSWGSTDTGQPWSVKGGSAAFSVSEGKGVVTLTPSANREAAPLSASFQSSTTTASVALRVLPAKGATGVTFIGRRIGSSYYGGRLWINSDRTVRLYALRGETPLVDSHLVTSNYAAGTEYNVKSEVSGAFPTTVRVKVWAVGASEPAGWTLSATDSSAGLQSTGSSSIMCYFSSSGGGTSAVALDDFRFVGKS